MHDTYLAINIDVFHCTICIGYMNAIIGIEFQGCVLCASIGE